MLRTHHWIDMHIVIGRESANAKLWFKLSTLKNNKENARLYFNDLLRDQFSSVAQSCPTLYNPMDCSTPGFPVLHYLSESAWTHVHWVGHAIQPSHPLSSPSPPGSIFPRIRVFSNESVLHIRWPKYWSLTFSISPSNEGKDCPRDSQDSSPTPQFQSTNSSVLSFLYGPTLTSVHDY